MTDTSERPEQAATYGRSATAERPQTAWAGWVAFGAVMMIMLGLFQIIQGLVALLDDGYYVVAKSGLVVNVDYTAWGWLHLAIGIIAGLAGVGLLVGNMVARVAGVVVALVSAVVNLAFMPAYPIWSTIIITIDVIVIFAIVAHGSELKSDTY